MEESVSLEMDNHVLLDKEDGCYDNTEAAFSDDEEEINNKGEGKEGHILLLHSTQILDNVRTMLTLNYTRLNT